MWNARKVGAEAAADAARHLARMRALLSLPGRRPWRSSRPGHRQRGAAPDRTDRSSLISSTSSTAAISWRSTPTIVGGALALAMIASIDALLCTKLVMAPGEPRRDGDRVLPPTRPRATSRPACFGGITGGINIGASIANRTFGAVRRLSVLINAAVLLVVSVFFFSWLGRIPRVGAIGGDHGDRRAAFRSVEPAAAWPRARCAPRSMRISTAFDLLVVIVGRCVLDRAQYRHSPFSSA